MDDEERIRLFRDKLETELIAKIPFLEVNGQGAPRLPNTLNLACHYIEGESILYELNAQGVCASSGSACSAGSLEPSHVVRALGLGEELAHSLVRFSLGRESTEAEVAQVEQVLPEILRRVRSAPRGR